LNTRLARPLACLAISVACLGLITVGHAATHAGDGLAGHYYANRTWTDPEVLSYADADISTGAIARRWGGNPPPVFSARWFGYLTVRADGIYAFSLTSDDGARLFIDNVLVIDNSGVHPASGRTGSAQLGPGSHLILIDYIQDGGSFVLEWLWSTGGALYSPVPAWLLSQRRVSYTAALAGRAFVWLWWLTAVLVAVSALWTIRRGNIDTHTWLRVRQYPRLACFALFVALTVLETWPLAGDPSHRSRNDNGDTILNEWAIGWVAHQVVRDPLHLFQANIFYPEANTLAFSEAILVQSAIAAPLLWAGASPVLAYNLVLMAGLTLTGFAMCLVVRRWTNDWAAGIAAGILLAFSAHALTRLPHLQAQHVEFLPLALLALDRLLAHPRLRHAGSLALWFALQALSSYYLFVMTTLGLAAAVVSRPESWWGRRGLDIAKSLVAAAALASLVLLPYLWPYWRAHADQGLNRSLEAIAPALWRDYLTTPARFDYWLLERWTSSTGLFPGFVGLALTAYAIATGTLRDPRARMCLALGVCGVTLSFGAGLPGFSLLYAAFTPLHGIRAIGRFGYLGTVAVAVLGGFGLAAMRRRIGRPVLAIAAGIVVPLVLTLESLAAPIGYRRFEGIPPIYHRLDAEPSAVVADLPLAAHQVIYLNAPAMLNSTTSFYRLVNGYSGFIPASYFRISDAVASFPAAGAIAALKANGVTHVFVHDDEYSPAQIEQIRQTPDLRQIAADGLVALYELRRGS
jgi:hypothetical protein